MRYKETEAFGPLYRDTDGLHFMLNFTVVLALVIGVVLFWLALRGRVLWLKVWSVGLVLSSVAYLTAAALGYVR